MLKHTDCTSFAPRDVTSSDTAEGISHLFERFSIPSAFIEESLQGVSQSFAAHRDTDGTTYVWFHLLCKDLAVAGDRIVHPQNPSDLQDRCGKSRVEAQGQSQANFTWLKPGFILRIRPARTNSPKPSRMTTSSSDDTLTTAPVQAKAEMFCFGAPITLRDRFQRMMNLATCDDILQDPYVLLEVVLEEMHKVMDRTGWTLSDVFGNIELVRVCSMQCERNLMVH